MSRASMANANSVEGNAVADERPITCPTMTVDLEKVRRNFRRLVQVAGSAKCAAIVKGDAYGHGMVACADALAEAGAKLFFVATCDAAITLRRSRPADTICVLAGPLPGEERAFLQYELVPVLNDLDQLRRWSGAAKSAQLALDAILHFDTGMNRLGLQSGDAAWLADNLEVLASLKPLYYMTHLSAADDLDFDRCRAQRADFLKMVAGLPSAPLSIANSAASFFGEDFSFALIRPGKATFGINPLTGRPNPMERPATVHAPIVQIKTMRRAEAVGYSSTVRLLEPSRIATVSIGYANGYPRGGSNRASVAVGSFTAPIMGRVSMDLITIDVSSIPERLVYPGAPVEILGSAISDAALAQSAGTIEHDILIALGRGCERRYLNA